MSEIKNLVEVTGYAVVTCQLFHNTFSPFPIDFLEWACYNIHAHIFGLGRLFSALLAGFGKGLSFTRWKIVCLRLAL